MKLAVIVMSDPKSNSEEALTRLLNALGVVDEAKRLGDDVGLAFAGTGTRWPGELNNPLHAAHTRWQGVRDRVIGASRACAARNGATESLAAAGVPLVGNNEIPGTVGTLSVRQLLAEGNQVLVY